MTKHDGPVNWSNAKKARIFAHIIGHLANKYGKDGVLRIPLSTFDEGTRVGFDTDGPDLLIVVDTDGVETSS